MKKLLLFNEFVGSHQISGSYICRLCDSESPQIASNFLRICASFMCFHAQTDGRVPVVCLQIGDTKTNANISFSKISFFNLRIIVLESKILQRLHSESHIQFLQLLIRILIMIKLALSID